MHFANLVKEAKEEPSRFRRRLDKQLRDAELSNPSLNCFLKLFLSSENLNQLFPLIEKRKIDKPLFGLTCAVKDCFAVKGHSLSGGLNPPVIPHSNTHSGPVARFVDQGVSLLGSTNLDPLCLGATGDNKYFGRVKQTHFRERITGGSSSGSASAVAAELCDFALGSDLSGSARIPAAACCVTGMRCSSNLFSKTDSLLLDSMVDSVGIISIEASDIAFLLAQLSNSERCEIERKKLILPSESEIAVLDLYSENAFSDTLNRLESKFDINNDLTVGFDKANTLIKDLVALDFRDKIETYQVEVLPDAAKALCSLASGFNAYKREELRERQSALRESVTSILGEDSFIASPTLPIRPPAWKSLHREKQLVDNLPFYLTLANVCDLPAISIVLGVPGDQFPFSLQLIGPPESDVELATFAASVQEYLMTN